jgi:2-polyprenyl-3-methyl-5-hydroxy-6-metoxy-1,4-benzoquinol methylase
LPIPDTLSASARLLASKPEIAVRPVESCLGDPASGSNVVATGYDFEYRTCSNHFEIRQANDCALQFLSPQPATESLGVIYPPDYMPFQFNELRGPTRWARDFIQGGKARSILKLAGPNGQILDVGSGSGVLLRQIARVKGSRENLWANDFSEEVVAPLRREGFQILVGRAEELNTPDRFHVITLNQVIEHLPNPKAVVERLRDLLAPGGYLFFETPSTDGLDARLFRKRYWGGYHIPRHFWLFNESSLRQLFEGAGLRVVEFRYLCSPVFWVQSFHHLMLDHGWFWLARLISEKNPLLLAPFTAIDLIHITLGGKTTNIRAVAQKPD